MYKVETQRRMSIPIESFPAEVFYQKLVHWGFDREDCMVFDSGGSKSDRFCQFDWLFMADAERRYSPAQVLNRRPSDFQDWVGFVLAYDFKETLLGHTTKLQALLQMPDAYFFCPRWVFYAKGGRIFADILHEDFPEFERLVRYIEQIPIKELDNNTCPEYQAVTAKESYIKAFDTIQQHLYRGDIYEMNYCVFFTSDTRIEDLPGTWLRNSSLKKVPMGGLFKIGSTCVLCHSPERFFAIRDKFIHSQPIKGTIKRGASSAEDEQLKKKLYESTKERAENVMIVDLVRNDISRVCVPGSIVVDELFGIHTFSSVHQMISTISGTLCDEATMGQILKALFPMGSMTGAPKLSAMNIIRSVESHDRGLYSGTAGYISPTGDMDSNVIIRSVVADLTSGTSFIGVGSAVTVYANAEDEYEECILKLSSVIR